MEKYKSKNWLVDQYLNKNRSCDDIAKEEKRDPKTIWSWLIKFGIKTRSRGAESSSGTFIKGHKKGVGRIHTEETKLKIREARLKDGHVPYLKNGIHWLQHPGAVSPMWKGGVSPERQSVYSSKEWVNAVKAVWKRDNAICQRCGIHHNTQDQRGNFHIHHIVPFTVKEKRTDPNNLMLFCKHCHKWIHSKLNKNKLWLKNK